MSSVPRTFSAEQIKEAGRQLVAAEPLLHTVPAAELIARAGWAPWTSASADDDDILPADLGFGIAEGLVYLSVDDDGTVDYISVSVCDNTGPPVTPELTAAVRDAFVLAARALTEEFGRPYDNRPGDDPEIWWRLGPASLILHPLRTTTRLALWRTTDYEAALAADAAEDDE